MREHFSGTVTDGKLVLDDPIRWRGILARHEKRRVSLVLSREQIRRTSAQNSFYWAMVVPIFSEWSGYEKDEAHDVLKQKFLPATERPLPTGELVATPPSTTRLTVAEFSEYVDRVCRWLAENGVYVPQPGEKVEASL